MAFLKTITFWLYSSLYFLNHSLENSEFNWNWLKFVKCLMTKVAFRILCKCRNMTLKEIKKFSCHSKQILGVTGRKWKTLQKLFWKLFQTYGMKWGRAELVERRL